MTNEAPGTHIDGWMSSAELEWLCAQAALMGSVAEVGAYKGRSTFALLTGCTGEVWVVDPWQGEEWAYGDASFEDFEANVGHFANLRVVRGYSPAAAAQVPEVDMVFIDGDHGYEAMAADIEAWTPKARRLICGHDYGHLKWEGVWRAVDEAFGERVEHVAESIWAVAL